MNIKKILSLLCLAFWSMAIPAQNSTKQSLLYKIEGDNIQTSYLFGTMHLLPQESFNLKKKVVQAFEICQQVVLELDMDEPGLQGDVMKNMSMKDGLTLDKLMKAEDYQVLDNTMQKLIGASVKMFNSWKPIGITSMLYMKYIGSQPASFENTFVSMAKEQEKEVLGLETVAEQMQVFEDIPYQEQIKDVVDLLYEEERNQAIFSEMVALYNQEDVAALHTFTIKYLDTEAEQKFMLDKRNQKWIPRIGKLATEKATFFGVGAAHLGGDQGVIKLLQDAGYKVTPVI